LPQRFFLLLILLGGCDIGRQDNETTPKGWQRYAVFGYVTYVVPVTLEDGTRCVAVVGSNAGRGITCDWGRK
jgi:hypothetical protein